MVRGLCAGTSVEGRSHLPYVKRDRLGVGQDLISSACRFYAFDCLLLNMKFMYFDRFG